MVTDLLPFQLIDPDVILAVVSWLDVDDVVNLLAVDKFMAATVSCPSIWSAFLDAEVERYPDVSLPAIDGMNAVRLFFVFRRAGQAAMGKELLRRRADWMQKPCSFNALRGILGEGGTLEAGGTPGAQFAPRRDLGSQPSVVAMELLKFFDKAPRREKGTIIGDKYERTATLLGCTQHSVRKLEARVLKLRLAPAAQAQELAKPFPDAEMQRGGGKGHLFQRLRPSSHLLASAAHAAQRSLARLKPLYAQLETRFYQTVFELAAERQRADSNQRSAAALAKAQAQIVLLQPQATMAVAEGQQASTALRTAQRRLAAAEKLMRQSQGTRDRQLVTAARVRKQRDDEVAERGRLDGVLRELRAELQATKDVAAVRGQQLGETRQQLDVASQRCAAGDVELRAELDAERLARLDAERRAAFSWDAFKLAYRRESTEQRQSKTTSPNKVAIAANYIGALEPGAVVKLSAGSGANYAVQRMWHVKKGSADLQAKQLRRRSNGISNVLTTAVGGEEHLVAQMTDHKKANPKLYLELGMKTVCQLNLDSSLALVSKVSGSLGEQYLAFLKREGAVVAPRSAIRQARKDATPDAECGRIVIEDTKKRNKKRIRSWLRVLSVINAIQKVIDQQVEGDVFSWPANIPSNIVMIVPVHDKGGGCDKLLAKIVNAEKSDSPARTCMLGLFDTDDDGYAMSRLAFLPLYRQLSELEDKLPGVFRVPWKPRLPPRIMLNSEGDPVWKPVEPAPHKKGSSVAVKLTNISWKYGGHFISVDVRPRRQHVRPASKVGRVADVLGKPAHATAAAAPAGDATPEARLALKRQWDSEWEKSAVVGQLLASSPPAVTPPTAQLATPPIAFASSPVAPSAATLPPPKRRRPSKYSATLKRLAHCRNDPGEDFQPKRPRSFGPPPRLQGCTWSADCDECAQLADGEMGALQRQVADARKCKRAGAGATLDCRAKVVWGGDMLSLCHPAGHGGPTSKEGCLKCHASLHNTNAAGIPQLRTMPEGWTETRAAHFANPPPRAGTASMQHWSTLYRAAVKAYEVTGKGGKPEPMAFASCIHNPLYRVRNSFEDEVSNIPLHLLIGLVTDYFHALEGRMDQLDSWAADMLELPPTGNTDVVKRLIKHLSAMEKARAEQQTAAGECLDHSNALAALRDHEHGEAAFEAAAQRKRSKREVPLEAEVRTHQKALGLAERRMAVANEAAARLGRELVELRAEVPGPCRKQWNELLHAMRLKCAAYHGGQLVGDDADAVLLPEPIAALTNCMRPRVLSRVWPVAQPDGTVRVSFRVCAPGSDTEASLFADLLSRFAQCVSLFARKEPLCDHEIALFAKRRDQHQVAYAKAFPQKEPTMKVHWLGYHLYQQLARWGSAGQFHEGVVEAAHVVDNELKRRFACITDPLQQLRMRLEAYANLADASRMRLSGAKEGRQAASRKKRNAGARRKRHAMSCEE